ncbi:signal peptidase I [Nocardioides dongkuii]|uniref:signal peptidase I n=1 Tax=Nocardioides dongkuii TaxID=2760089 RepID=UPI001FD426CD|nr:signal peptidase I [Nocardioides dongkuii]
MTTEDRGTPPVDNDGAGDPRSSSSSGSSSGSSAGPAKRRKLSAWQETVVLLVVAVALAAFVKAFLVQSFYIPSESMEPGLVRNDRIVVQKPSYWFGGEPQRGDVVVFEDPGGWLDAGSSGPTSPLSKALAAVGLYPTGGHLVKRVIGVEGDVIECCDDEGRLLVNGVPVEESEYAVTDGEKCFGPMPNGGSGCRQGWTAGPVPEGELFVMGDNRAHSADSSARLCRPGRESCATDPFVDEDLVVGRLLARVWPADRFDVTDGVDAFADVPDPS